MKFAFIAKHRSIWPVAWQCEALGVSRSGFHAWLTRCRSTRALIDEALIPRIRASFASSARTYGARRVWRDVLAEGVSCGLHKIERLMRSEALRARPRRRRIPAHDGQRSVASIAPNVLDRQCTAERPNQKFPISPTSGRPKAGLRCGRNRPVLAAGRRLGHEGGDGRGTCYGWRYYGNLGAGEGQWLAAPLGSGQPVHE